MEIAYCFQPPSFIFNRILFSSSYFHCHPIYTPLSQLTVERLHHKSIFLDNKHQNGNINAPGYCKMIVSNYTTSWYYHVAHWSLYIPCSITGTHTVWQQYQKAILIHLVSVTAVPREPNGGSFSVVIIILLSSFCENMKQYSVHRFCCVFIICLDQASPLTVSVNDEIKRCAVNRTSKLRNKNFNGQCLNSIQCSLPETIVMAGLNVIIVIFSATPEHSNLLGVSLNWTWVCW